MAARAGTGSSARARARRDGDQAVVGRIDDALVHGAAARLLAAIDGLAERSLHAALHTPAEVGHLIPEERDLLDGVARERERHGGREQEEVAQVIGLAGGRRQLEHGPGHARVIARARDRGLHAEGVAHAALAQAEERARGERHRDHELSVAVSERELSTSSSCTRSVRPAAARPG
jgi:hypothetical protein